MKKPAFLLVTGTRATTVRRVSARMRLSQAPFYREPALAERVRAYVLSNLSESGPALRIQPQRFPALSLLPMRHVYRCRYAPGGQSASAAKSRGGRSSS